MAHHAEELGSQPLQRLQAGASPLLLAMGAGVGDGRRRLRREQQQHVLVLVRELSSAPLAGEEEAADVRAAMAHRRPLEGLRRNQVDGEPERPDVARQVRQPERRREIAQVVEELQPVRQPALHLAVLLGSEPGGDEIAGRAGVVDRRDDPVARVRELAGAVDDLLQDGGFVEARGDPQHGGAELRGAVAERRDVAFVLVRCGHWSVFVRERATRPRTARGPPGGRRPGSRRRAPAPRAVAFMEINASGRKMNGKFTLLV